MSEEASAVPKVEVVERIEFHTNGSMVTVDPGVFDAAFLWDMLGETAYMQAYADGQLKLVHGVPHE